jgi:phosphocarrier protein HPr
MDAPNVRASATLVNKRGLHARASAKFVETVARFQCDVTVKKDDTEVSGRSIMGLMMLGASVGTTVELMAVGADADDAIAALCRLIAARFYEDS